MAALTVQEVTPAGITPTYAAAAGGGDTFAPTSPDPYVIHVKNAGSTITLTVNDPISASPAGATAFNADLAVSVTGGQERMIEIDPARFTNPANGNVEITYSGVTTVTIGVFLSRR